MCTINKTLNFPLIVLKICPTLASFYIFSCFWNIKSTEKIVGSSRIQTQIVRAEGEHADHLTTDPFSHQFAVQAFLYLTSLSSLHPLTFIDLKCTHFRSLSLWSQMGQHYLSLSNTPIHTKNIRRTAQGSWWRQHKTLKDPLLNDCQLTIKFLLTGLGVNKILTFDD